jgi:myo-inositol 2-dehydrogenase/D-chiro-inositol 1-dehydrogenase
LRAGPPGKDDDGDERGKPPSERQISALELSLVTSSGFNQGRSASWPAARVRTGKSCRPHTGKLEGGLPRTRCRHFLAYSSRGIAQFLPTGQIASLPAAPAHWLGTPARGGATTMMDIEASGRKDRLVGVNVGVIGVGMIGQDHIRRLTHVLSGARVVAVSDADLKRARSVADDLPGCRVHQTGADLIADEGVDAVLICSWGETHEEFVLASIEAGKQVFCEKPLATIEAACSRIIDAEVAAGRRMVMVGFMRRYDAGYRGMKQTLSQGDIGAPLIMYSTHRNASVPASVTSQMIVIDTCVHDIDVARWLLDSEVAATQILRPRRSNRAAEYLQDPLVLLLEMSSGTLVVIEALVNCGYGYDIRGEIVGETGTVALAESSNVIVRREGQYSGRVPGDWRERFVRSYDEELQEWITAASAGVSTGPSSWDGYVATVVTDAGVAALNNGGRVEVSLRDQPELYRQVR